MVESTNPTPAINGLNTNELALADFLEHVKTLQDPD